MKLRNQKEKRGKIICLLKKRRYGKVGKMAECEDISICDRNNGREKNALVAMFAN